MSPPVEVEDKVLKPQVLDLGRRALLDDSDQVDANELKPDRS